MYFLLITLFLFIYASTIASSKQLIVVENNETRVSLESYQIIVADVADAVSVNFSGRCKFLQI